MSSVVHEGLRELHPYHSRVREELADLVQSRGVSAPGEIRLDELRQTSGPFLSEKAENISSKMQDDCPPVHVLLHGPAGVGKHHLAESLRRVIGQKTPVWIMDSQTTAGPVPETGMVIWIRRENARPERAPAQLTRIEVRSLTVAEAYKLFKDHIVPETCQAFGVAPASFQNAAALAAIVRGGMVEAGIHGATQRLRRLCRRRVSEIGNANARNIDDAWLSEVLGPESKPQDVPPLDLPPGSVHAPMVSSWGGAIARVEAVAYPGSGRMQVTGAGPQAEVAARVARTRLLAVGIHLHWSAQRWRETDWHLHVSGPAGAKDGASLGWPMMVAMLSHLAGRSVDSRRAFTGELTLSGQLLPVGGVVEKLLACERLGFRSLSLPEGNGVELARLPVQCLQACVPHEVSQDLLALRPLQLLEAGNA